MYTNQLVAKITMELDRNDTETKIEERGLKKERD